MTLKSMPFNALLISDRVRGQVVDILHSECHQHRLYLGGEKAADIDTEGVE